MKKLSKRVLAVILTIAMLLPMGTFGVVSNAEINIPSDAVMFNGNAYKVYKDSLSWVEAKEYCEKLGGHLATIVSEEEQRFIEGIIEDVEQPYVRLGACRDADNNFVWVTSEPFEYTNWAKGEPNNIRNSEKYLMLYTAISGFETGKWNDTATNYPNYKYAFVCEWENAQRYPDGYNFETDSYNFINYSSMIPYGYFKTMYGEAKGYELWKNKWWQGGLCFGFTYTTAAFYNGLPSCDTIRDLSKSSVISIGNNSLSVATYIKYAHIYQYSEEFKGHSVWSDAKTIYNLVKQAAMDNLLTVTIGMSHETDGGHRVLAIGIDGNDILIDDPNYTNQIQRITVNDDGSWEFSGLDGWNSNTCRIRYSLDITEPYKFLRSLKTLTANEAFIDDSTIDSFSSSYEADTLSKDYLLLSVDSDTYDIANTGVSKIEAEYNDGTDVAEQGDLYWVAEDKTVTVTGVSENSEIELAGNDTIIGVTTSDSSSVKLTVDEESDIITATLDTTTGNEYSLRLRSFDEASNAVTATITGTADGDTVTASETSDGVQVTGLNDITVTLETADGSAETSAKVTDGETVNITVDDPNNTVTTDWQCKHPDDNHDGVCDNCGEDFTKDCDCFCHSESKFMQFIYKIVRFLWKLFGIEDRHFCACGKAHW